MKFGEDSIRYDFFCALSEVFSLEPWQIQIEFAVNENAYIPRNNQNSQRKEKPMLDLILETGGTKMCAEFALFRENSNPKGNINKTARTVKMMNDMIRVALDTKYSGRTGYFICVADHKMLGHHLRSKTAAAYLISGLVIYFGSYFALSSGMGTVRISLVYMISCSSGFLLMLTGGTLLSRIIKHNLSGDIFNAQNETFPQEERLLTNEYSINLPAKYRLKGKVRRSWINLVAVFRACIVSGNPGAGKTAYVIRHFISQALNRPAVGTAIGTAVGGWALGIGTAIGAIIGTIAGGLVGLFGAMKKDARWDSLFEIYPELIKQNGELNVSLAQSLIANNQLDDKTKSYLQNLIDANEEWEKAKQQITDIVSDLTGNLGGDLRDVLVKAFEDGTDAAKDFADTVEKTLENALSNLIFSAVFSRAFDALQSNLEGSLENLNGLSFQSIFADFLSQSEDLTKQFNDLMKTAQEEGEKLGLDLFNGQDRSSGINSLSGAIKGITEQTANVLEGQINAMRINQAESLGVVRQQLMQLSTIANNTSYNVYLKSIDRRLAALSGDQLRSAGFGNSQFPQI